MILITESNTCGLKFSEHYAYMPLLKFHIPPLQGCNESFYDFLNEAAVVIGAVAFSLTICQVRWDFQRDLSRRIHTYIYSYLQFSLIV